MKKNDGIKEIIEKYKEMKNAPEAETSKGK